MPATARREAWLGRLTGPAMRRLWRYMAPHRAILFPGLLCTLLTALFNLANLKLLKIIGDTLQTGRTDGLDTVGLTILAVFSGRALFNFGQTFLVSNAMQLMTRDLRNDVYAHIQSLPLHFFESRRTGQLMSSITSDVPAVQQAFQTGMVDSINAPVMVIGTIAAMVHYSVRLTLTVIIVVPIMLFVIKKASERMRLASAQIQQRSQDISDTLQETLSGVRVVKSFTMEERETERFRERSQEAHRAAMRSVRVRAFLAPAIEFLATGGFVVVLWVGVQMVAHKQLSVGDLAAFLLAVNQLGANAKNLGNIRMTLSSLDAASERLFALLDTKSDIVEKPNAVTLGRAEGDVEFQDVSFAYGEGPDVLRRVSFRAAPGEVVALVGRSGAGKSTVANLVPRFYDVTGGSLLVDGRDVRDYTLRSLRRQIGIVPQETLLFSGSVLDNIRYGRPDATDAEVRDAARAAHADRFVEALPHGYDTVVGERGLKLSGGQRQRIAIARALLKDPRILILDEATSALDTESETLVQDALSLLMRGRTTLVIAHRLSTIRNADRILVLDAGRVVEEGTHAALMERDGAYARLYAMQFHGGAHSETPADAPHAAGRDAATG